jgi:hypothetical protein
MKKKRKQNLRDELRSEYDLSKLKRGVSGKYLNGYEVGANLGEPPHNLAPPLLLLRACHAISRPARGRIAPHRRGPGHEARPLCLATGSSVQRRSFASCAFRLDHEERGRNEAQNHNRQQRKHILVCDGRGLLL